MKKDRKVALKSLNQTEILTIAASSLNKLLVKKGVVSKRELLKAFVKEAKRFKGRKKK
jgi:hypothetical protein